MAEELRGIVRIGDADVVGHKTLYYALRQVKGVSFMMANAVCMTSDLDQNMQVGALTDAQIEKIESILKNPQGIPSWLYNRRKDNETGTDKHLISSDLRLNVDFDIKNMKKIKTYKGMRHSIGQPVRGQNTKAHFRKGSAIGVKKAKRGKTG
ncbi:MAG: 30S ribosomal protein S13 [Candidatus Nanoarchaeia archaeon]|nr:30S ribosomal protein S13 [Candidatus Nanoarchaeia archaeon]